MTLKDAIRAVEEYSGDKVHSVGDRGDEWYMDFESAARIAEEAAKLPFPDSIIHSASCTTSICINKTTGVMRYALFSEDEGTPVPLPE